jgi:hypothetical protein
MHHTALLLLHHKAKRVAEEQALRASKLAVPGLVNPHDRPPEEDMADL